MSATASLKTGEKGQDFDGGLLVVTTGTGSGKAERLLPPLYQNAFEDSVCLRQTGLTALLVYPVNVLANDREECLPQSTFQATTKGLQTAPP